MASEIGKELRKLRIDENERLLDMAGRINKSASFISAVEVGKKSPPVDFEELVIQVYNLASEAADRLRKAADSSRKAFTIEPNSELGRNTAGLFARHMNDLTEKQLKEIQDILNKE